MGKRGTVGKCVLAEFVRRNAADNVDVLYDAATHSQCTRLFERNRRAECMATHFI